MPGFINRPAPLRSLLVWVAFLGICLPLASQISITRYDYLNRRAKKETNEEETFQIFLAITDIKGDKGQAFDKSKGNTFDFGGAEKGLVDITIDFPQQSDYRLILRKDCLTATSNLSLYGPHSLKGRDEKFSTEKKIQYLATANGTYEIKVNYYILHKDLDPAELDCAKGANSITFTGEIKGIVTKSEAEEAAAVKPSDVNCDEVIAANKDNCNLLLEMIRTNSACIFEARDALFAHKQELYKQCFDGKSLTACDAFLNCDPKDSRIGAVRNRAKELEELGDKGQETPDIVQWRKIEKSADFKSFQDFYYQYPKSRYHTRALDSLSKYYPWTLTLVEKQGNRRIYAIDSIQYVKNLRWKDVSPLEGLVIDAANLPLDGKVEVSSRELGDYLIYFRDAFGRQDSISFSTQLKGTLKPGKDKYTVYFEGGTPPYQIELVDMGQNKTVKSYPSVKTDSFAIAMADVKALDLTHLKVWIKDASDIRVSAEGDILLVDPINFQRIAAFALIILLSLLVLYLLLSFIRRRRRKSIQFQEA